MEIVGRANEPWDALFIFHFLSAETDEAIAERLQKLVAREAATGLDSNAVVTAGKTKGPCRILGRFLEHNECHSLLSAWNDPDGRLPFMCYTPNHGIATVRNGRLDWWALICFQCANAHWSGPLAIGSGGRLLEPKSALQKHLIDFLPERPFPIR